MAEIEINRSWLVQRLMKSHEGSGPWVSLKEALAGVAGPMPGRLPKEAMKLLRPIFSFDYMGSSEFECGEVPRALLKIIEKVLDGQIVASTLTVPVNPDYFYGKGENPRETTFYILQSKTLDDARSAQQLIEDQAGERKIRLKEHMDIQKAVFEPGRISSPIGWLELDNGFFIFRDYQAFQKTAALLGVEHKIPAPPTPLVETTQARKVPTRAKPKKRPVSKTNPQIS